ncbi:MAG TPA: SRPBCC family protein [Actinomycetales bacterium]|nr:SRPBCC family protein [Actinomycetales bacterium]
MTDTTTQTTETTKGALGGALSQLPVDRLKGEAQNFGKALGHKGASMASSGIESLTGRLVRYAAGKAVSKVGENLSETASPLKEGVKEGAKNLAEGDSPLAEGAKAIAEGDSPVKAGFKALGAKVKDSVKKAFGGGGGKLKVTNIVEAIDVPVSRDVAYRQWTQFEDFPSFMKKVENVKQEEDQVLDWKAQIFWSHRAWKATIVEQVPNQRIVWHSEGEKGHIDGAVTFHELAPDLTRILVTLEYYPKGLFEHTGNLWRAQGRRARLELKHFRRYVSTGTLLHPEEVPGWMGEIRDEEVTDSGEGTSEEEPESSAEPSDESPSEESPSEESPSEESPSAKQAAPPTKKAAPPTKKAAPATKKSAPPAKKASPAKKAPAKKSGEPAAKRTESRQG